MEPLRREHVIPHMSAPVPDAAHATVDAWLEALTALFRARYGDRITDENRVLLVTTAATAVQRRLAKRNQQASREGAGPFSIQWDSASSSGGWFLPAEIKELDAAMGLGGTRTYRTPVPDTIRYTNRLRPVDDDVSGWWW